MENKSFAICVNNRGYEASLERWKVYEVVEDAKAVNYEKIRVIDESGEDYLFPHEFFVVVDLPKTVKEAMIASKSL